MKNPKKLFGVLMIAALLLGMCACSNGGNENQQTDDGGEVVLEIPEVVYGTWYPEPEVSEVPIVINADGTCVVNGENQHWVRKTVEKDTVKLTVGEGEEAFDIEFLYLTSNVPVLAEKYNGWSVKEPTLWDYTGSWYNEETGKSFQLSLFALKQAGCKITLEAGAMTVEVAEGDAITHTLKVTAQQCVVTDASGNSTTYVPSDYGM